MLTRASKEQRIVLTCDRLITHTPNSEHVYLLRANTKKVQLTEVVRAFKIELDAAAMMTRCNKCGAELIDKVFEFEELPKDSDVPDGVEKAHKEFWVCAGCGKVFWQGKQYENAIDHLSQRMEAMRGKPL
jgi:uncharacterized protein